MPLDRRSFLAASAAATTSLLAPSLAGAQSSTTRAARPPLPSALGRSAAAFGVRPDSSDDQTKALQRAIDETAKARMPLALPPGTYRTGLLRLPDGAQIIGIRGASRLMLTNGVPLLDIARGNAISLTDITLDGNQLPLPARHGLVHCQHTRAFLITGCDIINSGGDGIRLNNVSGTVSDNRITGIQHTALVSFDALGLLVARNTIIDTSDNGIEILRTSPGDDGTQVIDNRIEDIKAGPGGTGQHGNAINAFRAGNVIVRGNRIRNCDYSAVRGNSASNIQIIGNSVSDVREVALYSEFSFEGAVIANNTVDKAALGVSVANFNEGGRLCVVQGNIFRNLLPRRPIATAPHDRAGVGIYIEADTAVSGNVVENAPYFGILAGWGRYLRDVAITGNVVRNSAIGIGVSVMDGAGTTLISNNIIAQASRGAIMGLDHDRPITGDLTQESSARWLHLTIAGNVQR